jgi:hypothetical protein
MAAIMRSRLDSVMVHSELLTSLAQFVPRDEVNLRLRAFLCGLLPIGNLTFLNMKRTKCALSFFGSYLVRDELIADDR